MSVVGWRSLNCVGTRVTSGRVWPTGGRIWSTSVEVADSARNQPNLLEIGQNRADSAEAGTTKFRPKLRNNGAKPNKFDHIWPSGDQIWPATLPNLARFRLESARDQPNLARNLQMSIRNRPPSTQHGPRSANIGPGSPNFGMRPTKLGLMRPLDQHRRGNSQICAAALSPHYFVLHALTHQTTSTSPATPTTCLRCCW